MRTTKMAIFAITAFSILDLSLNMAQAFNPAKNFEKRCAGCHTIGEGADIGPDLKDVTKRREQQWLVNFVKDSYAVVEAGDPVAVKLFKKYRKKKMPGFELSDNEIISILKFIETGETGPLKAGEFKSALKATKNEILSGRAIFEGSIHLKNGGPACLSCHSAGDAGVLGGGTLAKNLTNTYTDYQDQGLSKVLSNINFTIMNQVFKGKELTKEEVYKLKSFLYKVDKESTKAKAADSNMKKFISMGLVLMLIILGGLDLLFRDRRKGTVRPTSEKR